MRKTERFVKVVDGAGVERLVRPVDAREIEAMGKVEWSNDLGAVSYSLEDSEAQLNDVPAQCAFIKSDGNQCSNKAGESGFCFIKSHQ